MRTASISLALCIACTTAGCKVTKPGALESGVITRAKHWVFVRNKAQKNPVAFSAENVDAGREAFSHYCVACHGLDGQNTGVPFADHMAPPIPSLASREVQSYSDGQLKWVIDYGISPAGMPASRGILNDEEIWSIVLFIRHLPKPGSLGEPSMYAGTNEKVCSKETSE